MPLTDSDLANLRRGAGREDIPPKTMDYALRAQKIFHRYNSGPLPLDTIIKCILDTNADVQAPKPVEKQKPLPEPEEEKPEADEMVSLQKLRNMEIEPDRPLLVSKYGKMVGAKFVERDPAGIIVLVYDDDPNKQVKVAPNRVFITELVGA